MTTNAPTRPPEESYFKFLATMGLTKHIGSQKATDELIELCHIDGHSTVLDVGCGVGVTACYLAKTFGCRVVGVDLLPEMVEQARNRARSLGLADRASFQAGDARQLPFADGIFDAVLVESMTVFFKDKLPVVRQYKRVTTPGGYIGLTEATWLTPPTQEAADYYLRTVYADTMQREGWQRLLEDAGLADVVTHTYKVDVRAEGQGRIKRYGCNGIMRAVARMTVAIFNDQNSRQFLGSIFSRMPKDIITNVGYGVYVGRKV